MGTYEEELQQKFDDNQRDLARNDLDHAMVESKLIRTERYTNQWHLFLEQLNDIEKKRQMIAGRLGFLRIEIEKQKPVYLNTKNL